MYIYININGTVSRNAERFLEDWISNDRYDLI